MSHDDTNTSTMAPRSLSDVKKERKQYEQDAALLSNRIKLLQLEEARTWKYIQETQRKQAALKEARKQAEEFTKIKEDCSKAYEKELELKQKRIKEIKFKIERGKQQHMNELQQAKKQTYFEQRFVRDKSMQQKYQIATENVIENKQRSKSVKIDHIKQSIRVKKLKEAKRVQAKEDYLKRINRENAVKSELEAKVTQMELLESELIKRLQNTQNYQQKVVTELESLRHNRKN
jgi:hypothetical protein